MSDASHTAPARVLIVDDDPAVGRVLRALLTQDGLVAEHVASAAEALQAFARLPYDVVVTDVWMPGASGVELLGELGRTHPQAAVLMLTAQATVSLAVEAMKLGALDFIVKPFDRAAILKAVHRAVEVARSRAAAHLVRAGSVLAGRYRLDRMIGRGGMGAVWAATHLITRREVAIKLVAAPPDAQQQLRARLLREARAAAALRHPNAVEVLEAFELGDETPVLVMELLLGETLGARLGRDGKLPPREAASLIASVAAALEAAHAMGIVHRDLKPDNVFLARTPAEDVVVKVLDFGIAKVLGDGAHSPESVTTQTGGLLGTPGYMAPEQALGAAVDARTDLFALGVILYECIAGSRPIGGHRMTEFVARMLSDSVVPLARAAPGVPDEIGRLVESLLARDPDRRPGAASEVRAVLERCAAAG